MAWRYAVWVVHQIHPRADVDLTDEDRHTMNAYKAEYRERYRPYTIVLRHERGPVLVQPDGIQTLHDGAKTVHLRVRGQLYPGWQIVAERYPVCSCHGDPWPCQDHDRDIVTAETMLKVERDLKGAEPGRCAHCLEVITSRQKSITFPEPSLIVPGAPPPRFHTRQQCWSGAVEYEIGRRLVADPGAERLVSCPGQAFRHEDGTGDCSAGLACTGHHGPPGREPWAEWCGCTVYTAGGSEEIRASRRCGSELCRGVGVGG